MRFVFFFLNNLGVVIFTVSVFIAFSYDALSLPSRCLILSRNIVDYKGYMNLQMTIETPTQHKTMKHEGFTNFTNLEKTFLHHSNARSFLARCKVLEKKIYRELFNVHSMVKIAAS